MQAIKCDIILPVCDQFEFTKNCIESIVGNTLAPYRLIVINNGKNENTKSYLSEIKNRLGDRLFVVQNETNIGWVKALNQGISISCAPFLCFQNDDTVVTKGWLGKMIEILEKNARIGLVNPSWEGRPNHMSIDDYGKILEAKHKGAYIETDWARGFSVVLKREVVDKIGNVDEVYGLAYFDDVDFSVRAINAGFLVAVALDTYVYHHRNVTFFQVLKGPGWNALHEKNKLIYYKRWGRPLKMAVIFDRGICKNRDALDRVKDTVYYLARRQHHIDIWSPCDIRREFLHTNIAFKSYRTFLMRLAAYLYLCFNKKKRAEKRYSAVFSYDSKFGKFINSNRWFKGIPLYYADTPTDAQFNSLVKKHADMLKEKTKGLIDVKM